MSLFETEYRQLLMRCLLNGEISENRTGVMTKKLFNQSFNIDLRKGFPIITGKKIFFDKALHEFLWIFKGDTNVDYLNQHNINWWNSYAKDKELGKVYGYQLRKYNGTFDQIKYVQKEIKNNSRRAVISLWNPTDLNDQALPCCYTQMTFVRENEFLNMAIDFRSSDIFLGLPYDIIFGALLLDHISKKVNLKPKFLGLSLKDAHIYAPHKNAAMEYYKQHIYKLPELQGALETYSLKGYRCGKYIKANLIT